MTITETAKIAHTHAKGCGFYKKNSKIEIIKKIAQEANELLFAIVNNRFGQNYRTFRALKYLKVGEIYRFENDVKNTVGDELADIIITALSGAVELGIDIEEHIKAKMMYNELREDHKHGK